MTASDTATRLLGWCTEERDRLSRVENADRRFAASRRRDWVQRGVTPIYDDPVMRVRASDLEAVCAALLARNDALMLLVDAHLNPPAEWLPEHHAVAEAAAGVLAPIVGAG